MHPAAAAVDPAQLNDLDQLLKEATELADISTVHLREVSGDEEIRGVADRVEQQQQQQQQPDDQQQQLDGKSFVESNKTEL